jgi:uncharacterized YigZ family protein
MLFITEYKTISGPTEGEFRDKGSVFMALAYPIKTENEFKKNMDAIKKTHPKANHHCYAFALGPGHQAHRFSDDREPAGTAGRPIMSVIKSNDLTDIMIVVVRYFGGTLLGVQGLIKAYRSSSEMAISKADIIVKQITERFEINFPYDRSGDIEYLIRKYEVEVISRDLTDKCRFIVDIPKQHVFSFVETIRTKHPFVIDCGISAC